jgi:hypothetical protein
VPGYLRRLERAENGLLVARHERLPRAVESALLRVGDPLTPAGLGRRVLGGELVGAAAVVAALGEAPERDAARTR